MRYCHLIGVCVLLLAFRGAAADDATPLADIRFNDHVRPILSEHCFACHGPDSAGRKGDLRLDLRDAAIECGSIVPCDSKGSELIARINSDDPELMMPPPDTRKKLSAEDKRLLAGWVNSGAEYQKHWSFLKPSRPAVPEAAIDKAWSKNAIDNFVLQKLAELRLTPNDSADRHVLARRAALDVTGLPPTSEMLDAFISDSSDAAWETYIDQLLKSEHAGEHRARYWLDAARYGDTHGMHVDNYREIWPYRDWVVRAFNNNMPFDRFVVEQLAGDLLPQPTRDQLIATGFSRCNISTSEGGAIPAELDVRYMVDRVETTATVFLGLTAGCAVCHDHKYDPISQREFYQLGAFFNNTTTQTMDGNQKDTPPVVTLPLPEYQKEWDKLIAERARLRTELDAVASNVAAWWPTRVREPLHPVSADDLILSLPLAEGAEAVKLPETAGWATEHPAGRRGIRFGEKGQLTAELPALRTDEPLTISFWYRTPERLMSTTLFDHTSKIGKNTIGWKISGNTQGGLTFEWNDGKGKKVRGLLAGEVALKPRSWQHLCIRYSGGQSNSSINILVNGRSEVLRNSSEDLCAAVQAPAGQLKIAPRMPTAGLSDIRIYRRWLPDEETNLLAAEFHLKELLKSGGDWNTLNAEQRQLAAAFHRATVESESMSRIRTFSATQQRRDYIYSRSTTTLVMQERPGPARAWVLDRGEYDQQRDEVSPWIPAVLNFDSDGFAANASEPNGLQATRLDLARWLVNPDHPLTARVMVNRLWQSVFGVGLVRTSEDFGVMGDRPSHPELLDWLAVEFVESGWNVNHIMKLILTSATYTQSSIVTPEKIAADPHNRYLARGPRLRMDAEVLRDQALAVSGLLRRDLGGPSVKPYQPSGLWNVVAITGSNTRVYERDTGDALYRRSMYIFWKRTSPPPTMAAFNAPTREQCTVRRERTNTPIQALVLMNDPQFVEAARRLAEHALQQRSDELSRAEWMLQRVLSRPANPADVADMVSAANDFRNLFADKPKAATELISIGDSKADATLNAIELAAWTLVANTLMNRDDFLNK